MIRGSPNSEPTIQPRTVVDEDIPTVRDKKDNCGRRRRTGSDKEISSDGDSKLFDRPVTESVTAWAGSDTDHPSGEHLEFCNRPVTESVTARAADTEEPLVMNVSTVTIELSELRTRVLGETDMSDIPVYKECCTPERRRPVKVSPDAQAQVVISDNQWNSRDCCFGVCKKADSVNRSGTGSCWDCLCWLVWGYRVSCLAGIVIKDRSHGIDLYTEKRRVCTSRLGLVGDPMTLCDIIPVYTKMNENFKGGLNNVMPRNNDLVDSRYHQRCVDNRHWSWTRASVCGNPIRETERFGCLDTSVCDADWSDECSVGLSPVWTFCNTVWDNISSEELIWRCRDFSVCQTMNGAALVDNPSGVTFNAELCIPWDAPEAVVDIDSAELVSLGSFPDKVGLFGRRKDAAVSRILMGRDSRSVRFLVPDTRGVDRSYHDVTVVDGGTGRHDAITGIVASGSFLII